MKITTEKHDDRITLTLDGWLDTLAAPELETAVNKIEGAKAIILDFDKVEYIASSGLRSIVASHRRAKEIGSSFSVINVCEKIMNIITLTGLEKKINIVAKA